MNRYQLAKIVEWAGTLRARKRMQKLIYLLQAAGCPLDVDYDLHHYGPYSEDVARTTDEMVREKLLGETTETYSYGEQYSYSLTPRSIDQIHRYEAEARGLEDARKIKPFEQLAQARRLRSEGTGSWLDDRLLSGDRPRLADCDRKDLCLQESGERYPDVEELRATCARSWTGPDSRCQIPLPGSTRD